MKKILLIHTGGTFGMVPLEPTEILAPGEFQDNILNSVPEINGLADMNVIIPFNLDSSNISGREWDLLAKLIYKERNRYDGFLLIHGTDTMVYTAAALSFSLLNFPKPIVITGAQRPLSMLRNDGRSNLIDAVELSTMTIPEVLIVFGQRILRGNRAKKVSISSYRAFDSPNYPYLGRIGVHIKLDRMRIRKPKKALKYQPGFAAQAMVLPIFPSTPVRNFFPLIQSGVRAFILQAYGAGNMPALNSDWISFIRQATRSDQAVFIASHSAQGTVNLGLYECGHKARHAGAVSIGDMTIESAYVKLQKILAFTKGRKEILEKFQENWAGEK